MPRVFFNLWGPANVFDEQGIGLANVQAARRHAFRLYATATHKHLISLSQEWRMEVTDASGRELFRLDFTTVDGQSIERLAG